MGETKLLRTVGAIGVIASAVAYVAFVQNHLNGDRSWHANKLWLTLIYYNFDRTAFGMAALALLSLAAFFFRRRLADRLLIAAFFLVAIPIMWICAEMALNIHYMDGLWFWGDSWRWFAAPIYAQFAIAMLLGFAGVLGLTIPHSAADSDVG